MTNTSRGLRETVVRALAKVGLVWALAVLGALFMVSSAQGQDRDGGYSLASSSAEAAATSAATSTSTFTVAAGEAPRTAGLALALTVLGAGMTVLALGGARGDRVRDRVRAHRVSEPATDLPLAMALGLLP